MATKNTILPILTLFSIFLPLAISIDFNYPAVFNFGDSNSDTGELTVGLGFFLDPPNGQHYFKTSTGRFCDGRLIIDFLSNFLTNYFKILYALLLFIFVPQHFFFLLISYIQFFSKRRISIPTSICIYNLHSHSKSWFKCLITLLVF